VAENQEAVQESIATEEAPILLTSTPEPTREPGVVDEAVSTVASTTNLDQVTFLGLTGEDWINIVISAVTFLVGYLIASWVVRVLLRWLVRRTHTQFDDAFLERIDGPVRYLVLVLFAQISVQRLTFWTETTLRFLSNLFFFLYLTIIFWIVWRLVGFTLEWYRQNKAIKTEEQADRMVIVPNSVIGKSQVINFTYPDSTVRIEVGLWLDYEEDLDKARRVVVEAVRQVEHVLPEQPVEALFLDFGESAVVFRVRWWIDSYVDTFLMYDKVNNAILEALRAADIAVAFPRQDFKFKIDADDAGRLSSAFGEKRNG